MKIELISRDSLEDALSLRDLSDPRSGHHAIQDLIVSAHEALTARWGSERLIHRGSPVVSVADNYDELGYPAEGRARDVRYTRYVTPSHVLRTQTTAAVPGLLRSLALNPPRNLLIVCPGLVYRRDVIDRLHVGEPHQMDLWRIVRGSLGVDDLLGMVHAVVESLLPRHRHRVVPSPHPYTIHGLQIDIEDGDEWVEIGECGLADPALLRRSGLDPTMSSGLAMGLGLDRILMLRKGIPDIRVIRSSDPRIVDQMRDLGPYKAVSNQPAIRRDLSVAVRNDLVAEEAGDIVRAALGSDVEYLESLDIMSETPAEELPESARARMGIAAGQKNLLLRLTIRHPSRTLTSGEANLLRDRVYTAIHQGLNREMSLR